MKSIDIVISVEESENLERLNYCVEARANLLTRILQGVISPSNKDIVIDKYMKEYEDLYLGHATAEEIPVCKVGSVIGTHIGPGAMAVAFFVK